MRSPRSSACVVLLAAALTVAACGGGDGGRFSPIGDTAAPETPGPDTRAPQTPVPDTASPDTQVPDTTVPRGDLEAALANLGPAGAGIDPRETFQEIATAINAASSAGSSPEEIRETVVVGLLRVLTQPGGADAVAYSDAFVNGEAAAIAVEDVTGVGRDGMRQDSAAGDVDAAGARQLPEVSFYYVNGVLNTQSQALASANLIASRLSRHLGRSVTVNQIYNESAGGPALTMIDGCAAAGQINPGLPGAELAASVCRTAKICATPGLVMQTVWDSIKSSFPQLVLQKFVDPDFASNPVNTTLEAAIRADAAAGRRSIVIAHSQGTLFLRNVLGRVADLPPGSVGGFYLAPAFGEGDDLRTASTRFVILRGDAISSLSSSTPTELGPSQQGGPLDIHQIDTYLREGTPSLQAFLDGVGELMRSAGAVSGLLSQFDADGEVHLARRRVANGAPGAGAAAVPDCPPDDSQPPASADTSAPSAEGTFSVSVSGFVSASLGPTWGDDANPRCDLNNGIYFIASGGGHGPDGAPYLWSVQVGGFYRGPGTYKEPEITASLANYDGRGYGWGIETGTFTIGGDERSGSFSIQMVPDRDGPADSGPVQMSGTFSCATVNRSP